MTALDYDMGEDDDGQHGLVQSSCTVHDWNSGDLRSETAAREAFDEHVEASGRVRSVGDLPWGGKEQWQPGERAHFEYHCWEHHDSADAQAWYRSHGQVTVLRENEDGNPRSDMPTHAERAEEGVPVTYQIRHDDGFEHTAFEDELLRGPEFFERPDPPSAPARLSADKTDGG